MPAFDAWLHALERIESDWPTTRHRNLGVLVGCSGGADSVLLVRALHHLRNAESDDCSEPRGDLSIAHFNHRLRGEDSDRDEQFVRDLGEELSVPVFVGQSHSGVRDEQGTRNQRRDFFGRICQETGSRYIALGHSMSDNVETVLHRLMRGTGPLGMNGIRPFRPLSDTPPTSDFVISRPLLGLTREEIRHAMTAAGHTWREDVSNDSSQYDRNWIRNEVLPLIRKQYPDADHAIARFIGAQQQWSGLIDQLADDWLEKAIVTREPLAILCRGELAETDVEAELPDQAVVVEGLRKCWMERHWPLQPMTQKHWDQAYRVFADNQMPAITLPGNIRMSRSGRQVLVERGATKMSI